MAVAEAYFLRKLDILAGKNIYFRYVRPQVQDQSTRHYTFISKVDVCFLELALSKENTSPRKTAGVFF